MGTGLRIEIQQTYAKVGLQRTPVQFSMEQPQADLQVRQIPTESHIEGTPSRLEINSSQARAAYGQRGVVPFINNLADGAYQQSLAGIARIAQDGDRMMDIANREDAVAELAYQHQFDRGLMEYVDSPSPHPVTIHYQPSSKKISWRLGDVEIHSQFNPPRIQFQRGKLETYLREQSGIFIHTVGKYLDELR